MPSEIVNSLEFLNNFLWKEREVQRAEEKEENINKAGVEALNKFKSLGKDASLPDIQTAMLESLSEAAGKNVLQEMVPTVSSLYNSRVGLAEYNKKEAAGENFKDYVTKSGEFSAFGNLSGLSPENILPALKLKQEGRMSLQGYENGENILNIIDIFKVNEDLTSPIISTHRIKDTHSAEAFAREKSLIDLKARYSLMEKQIGATSKANTNEIDQLKYLLGAAPKIKEIVDSSAEYLVSAFNQDKGALTSSGKYKGTPREQVDSFLRNPVSAKEFIEENSEELGYPVEIDFPGAAYIKDVDGKKERVEGKTWVPSKYKEEAENYVRYSNANKQVSQKVADLSYEASLSPQQRQAIEQDKIIDSYIAEFDNLSSNLTKQPAQVQQAIIKAVRTVSQDQTTDVNKLISRLNENQKKAIVIKMLESKTK